MHSECLTGDAFGSLKCDCGPQLERRARRHRRLGLGHPALSAPGRPRHRLVNKLRAYALQDQGFDTVDANLRLGFEDDERDFPVAARMLKALAQTRIRLLTNNPRKVAALEGGRIEVAGVEPVRIAAGEHNRALLATKRDRSGHQL